MRPAIGPLEFLSVGVAVFVAAEYHEAPGFWPGVGVALCAVGAVLVILSRLARLARERRR